MTKACHASAMAGFPPRGRSAVGLKGTPLLPCALLMSPSWKEANNARFVARRGRADTSSVQSTASRSCSWVKPSADECPMPTGNHPQSQPPPDACRHPWHTMSSHLPPQNQDAGCVTALLGFWPCKQLCQPMPAAFLTSTVVACRGFLTAQTVVITAALLEHPRTAAQPLRSPALAKC